MALRIEYDFSPRAHDAAPAAVTIGNFDGVHRGHARLLEQTVHEARAIGGESVVVTFEPHPRRVLDPDRCPPALTTLDEKRDLIAAHGIDRLVVLEFTRAMSRWSAGTFCTQLWEAFALRRLVVGRQFAFGHDRAGDVPFLRAWGRERGFEVTAVEPVVAGDEDVSSTLVRRALITGELDRANRLLGHPYFLDGLVQHGDKVGATLGYPTANLGINANKCLPSRGVYAMWLRVGDTWHMAATNIGFRPTFGGDRLTVEAFLLDFDGDLYGRRVRAAFAGRLREERMYPDAASLIAQIAIDVEETRRVLGAMAPPVALQPC